MTRSRPGDRGQPSGGGPADGNTISVGEPGTDDGGGPGADDVHRPGANDRARPGANGTGRPGANDAGRPGAKDPARLGVNGANDAGRAGADDADGAVGARARTRSPWRRAFVGLAAGFLVAGIVWALFGSKLLVVRSVVITGTHLVPVSQVRAAAAIPAGSPMIRVNAGSVARRVDAITRIQSAAVSKSWPDRIVITVRERTPALAVVVPSSAPGANGYDLIDPSGVIVRAARVRPPGLPLYLTSAPPGALRGSASVAAAVTVLHQVPAQISRSVVAVAAANPQDVTLGLSGGVTIVWGNAAQPREKAAELAILMRTHARYYDVSAPGTAVTR